MAHTPKYGGQIANPFSVPTLASRYDALSFRETPIELLRLDNNEPCGHASGFFWQHKSQSFLITNRHVVTGRDAFTNDLNKSAFVPERIRYFRPEWQDHGNDKSDLIRHPTDIALYENGLPIWLEHPRVSDLRVDIVAIKVPPLNDPSLPFHKNHVNQFGFDSLFHYVGHDVFVVGYPFRSYEGKMPAIWKRGSFASEPLIPVDAKPLFLIDATTTAGMSGSPIFRRVYGPVTFSNGTTDADRVVSTEFLGVYGGRIVSSEEGDRVSLGYGWHRNLIDEIFVALPQ